MRTSKSNIRNLANARKRRSLSESIARSFEEHLIIDQRTNEIWTSFQDYLRRERESRREEIKDALLACRKFGYEIKGWARMVDTEFQSRPFSALGSISVFPGGRFNYGRISDAFPDFEALYMAEDHPTCMAEKYGRSPDDPQMRKEEFSLRPSKIGGHSFYRIDGRLTDIIDLTDEKSLEPFIEVISKIKAPGHLQAISKNRLNKEIRTVETVEEMMSAIYEADFRRWVTEFGSPSVSQVFGHEVMTSGITGILYNSTRLDGKKCLVIFPTAFDEKPENRIELCDPASGVLPEDAFIAGRTLEE